MVVSVAMAAITKRGKLDDYEIIDRFAVGGAAELYRARRKGSHEIVVIKRLRTDLGFDPAVSAGFLREVQLAMLSDHKNLIHGLDRGSHEGADWVAVNFVDGQDLENLLVRAQEKQQRLSPAISLHIAREILDGLAFAFNIADPTGGPMGLVHRDLNPRNVLIGYDGTVHVADFGASVASISEPVPDEVVGSLGYLSPEQASLEHLDGRSDIFAVGCILYEMVTGKRAIDFDPRKEAASLKAHKKAKVKRMPRSVSEDVRYILDIALSRDREDRYMSASQMRDAIDEVLTQMREADLQPRLARLMQDAFAPELAERR